MGVKESLSILHLHSEYLRTLAEQLTTQFAKIEETLQGQPPLTSAEVASQVKGLIQSSVMVLNTAEILHQRLVAFSEKLLGEEAARVGPCPNTSL